MNFKQGDIVHIKGLGASLWKITELGDRDFYPDGNTLSEQPTKLVLFLPAPGYAHIAYVGPTFSHRQFMVPVPAMEVIARTVAAPSEMEQLQLEIKFKAVMRRLRQLQEQAYTFKKSSERLKGRARLKKFLKQTSDMFPTQDDFNAHWEFTNR